jgi:hypothetical protein
LPFQQADSSGLAEPRLHAGLDDQLSMLERGGQDMQDLEHISHGVNNPPRAQHTIGSNLKCISLDDAARP